MKYQILDKDGHSVLGDLTEDNCYLTAYAKYFTLRTHRQLVVNETIKASFSLSGESGVYDIKRIE